VLSITCIQAK